ncbi:MAG: ABC transporter ATP-binding protein [Desulfobacteraceae bacterium]|jgi:branched-chain amino acid transport system ATP-binding protein|nr:MAG: ABC transporter ATP-binding protein [Desulfobacteraceae bacterium]
MNRAANRQEILRVESISLSFGKVSALHNISFAVKRGEILSIIGPNGAGKTSMLNCINRFYVPQEGTIWYQEHDLARYRRHNISKLGIARTFQGLNLFEGMSVLDNIKLGRHCFIKTSFLSNGFYYGKTRQVELALRREIEETIVDLLEIEAFRKKIVGTLPYGLQKRVELGRALAMKPELLLLDEPMAGMNLEEREDMARFILDIRELWGITVVMVEHDMGVVMDISDRVCVLDYGRKIAEGQPGDIMNNPIVVKAYLGE